MGKILIGKFSRKGSLGNKPPRNACMLVSIKQLQNIIANKVSEEFIRGNNQRNMGGLVFVEGERDDGGLQSRSAKIYIDGFSSEIAWDVRHRDWVSKSWA